MADESEQENPNDQKSGPRFRRGEEDLDQLKGIEKQQQRSKQSRKKRKAPKAKKRKTYPLIDSIEKSKKRVKNRFRKIKDYDDAKKEFGG